MNWTVCSCNTLAGRENNYLLYSTTYSSTRLFDYQVRTIPEYCTYKHWFAERGFRSFPLINTIKPNSCICWLNIKIQQHIQYSAIHMIRSLSTTLITGSSPTETMTSSNDTISNKPDKPNTSTTRHCGYDNCKVKRNGQTKDESRTDL